MPVPSYALALEFSSWQSAAALAVGLVVTGLALLAGCTVSGWNKVAPTPEPPPPQPIYQPHYQAGELDYARDIESTWR